MNSTPEIPVGLATKIGQIVGAGFAVVAAVTAVLDGDLTEETITAMILSALSFYTLMGGRYVQAMALFRDAPSPKQTPTPAPVDPVAAGTMSTHDPRFPQQ